MTDEERQQLKLKMQQRFDADRAVETTNVVDNYNDADGVELHKKLEKSRKMSIILPIVLVLFVIIVGVGCFFMYKQLMNSQSGVTQTEIQTTESKSTESKADVNVETKSADKLMWSGEYDKEKIDEAVKNL